MKTKVKMIVLLLSLICVLSFSACTIIEQPGGHFFRASWGGALKNLPGEWLNDEPKEPGIYSPEYVQDKFIISGSSEIEQLFDETYSQSYSEEEQLWVRDERFTSLINGFDEEFFEDNQIVCFFVTASGGSYRFKLLETVYNNGILTIKLEQKSTGIGHDALVDWLAIIEVEKVPSDTIIDVVIKNRLW